MKALTRSAPLFPAFNRALKFAKPLWNDNAGEAGAFVAESLCGQFEAMAEQVAGGWRFWLVPFNDPENSLCMEGLCAS